MVVAEVPLWVVHSTEAPGEVPSNMGRASESLALLAGSGGTKKAAIYSIDVHPNGTKFATGGGDGAVRLWNSSSLFAKHRASFTRDATYQSSGAEESMSASSGGEQDESMSDAASAPEQVHDLNQLVRRKKDGSTPVKKQAASDVPLVASPQRKKDHHHHRLLCTLSAHTGSSVLAVRFSTSGQYLASAGDDAVVCVYAKSGSASGGNLEGSSSEEHWTRIKLCRGHTLDVVGLAWAPDDSHLVSCSLDSDAPIIVWKLDDLDSPRSALQNPYKILGKGIHTSTVKGVTFDPAGTYLASSGDDPAVCIWRAHDDWGLEKRISDGIFRTWNVQELSSQTLFRRLSWSTDGTYICSTNATVKNKHVASTISRQGWSVSGSTASAGAANLVGHKQPVVVSRHCPRLVNSRKQNGNTEENDDEPDYATLVALGDKRGFVTVWSTRKSKPIFKLQCSESRCTVTDLAWGLVPGGMILLVSLLDGQVVALQFGVPNELGPILSESDQNRVFSLRYGIDMDDSTGRRLFVGDNSAPKLIENALQFTLEEQDEDNDEEEPAGAAAAAGGTSSSSDDDVPLSQLGSPKTVRSLQSESSKGGKKRIRPVLMNVDQPAAKRPENGNSAKKKKKKGDTAQDALESAAKAASAAEGLRAKSPKVSQERATAADTSTEHATPHAHHHHHHARQAASTVSLGMPQIPHSTNRIHSVELPLRQDDTTTNSPTVTADCTNVLHVPKGSSGQPISCTTLSISQGGKALWRDEITGTSCSAIGASRNLLCVGTADGSIYLYRNSPGLGWACGTAFRSHPPLILGQAIVSLQFKESTSTAEEQVEMVAVTADGTFGVYRIQPELKLCYKGSILPAITHMLLAAYGSTHNDVDLPKLARIQLTDSNHLLMILSLGAPRREDRSSQPSSGVGGSLQAFVYERALELWMRVADSRFILSDFYSSLPASQRTTTVAKGALFQMEDAVRSGSVMSSIKPGRDGHSAAMFHNGEESGRSNAVTRSHCEDRMACAAALGSPDEFKSWLSLYIRTLTMGGHVDHLRLVVDMLLGNDSQQQDCPWLSLAPETLNLDRRDMVKSIVIPEMAKNRAMQRITNEISMELME